MLSFLTGIKKRGSTIKKGEEKKRRINGKRNSTETTPFD